jgi:dTMP kinase
MYKNPYPGKFILFEGLDGSGKTLQGEMLETRLRTAGKQVILTCEPTRDGTLAEQIKDILKHRVRASIETLQRLISEDRREHLDRIIIPALKEGNIVISDRYFFSGFAYGVSEVPLERLIEMNNDFILPDMTFVLTVAPEICIERISRRLEDAATQAEFFEQSEKLKKVMVGYESLKARFPDMIFLDGERPPDKIHADIVMKVESILE